jgi:glycosyltransferase involved in cell wall biosynthesis
MNNAAHRAAPLVSVIICTCNRSASVVATLETLFTNTYPHFEVILVDQSTTQETTQAISAFTNDHRLQYVPTPTKGLGRARNIGINRSRGELLIFTDDDCTVPANWLSVMVATFQRDARIGVVFCNVEPGPHDAEQGFIPNYVRRDSQCVRQLRDKRHVRGIGAGLALRRAMVDEIGMFDEYLGVGAPFRSAEDTDIVLRALLKGWWIYETHEVAVVHYGFRTWKQGRDLAKRDWFGMGADYAKLIKSGHFGVLSIACYDVAWFGLWPALRHALLLKKPHGLGRTIYFLQGFIKGWSTAVDPQTLVFAEMPRISSFGNVAAEPSVPKSRH